jgi:hypothetical protein
VHGQRPTNRTQWEATRNTTMGTRIGTKCGADEYRGIMAAKHEVIFTHPPCRRLDPPCSDGRPIPSPGGAPPRFAPALTTPTHTRKKCAKRGNIAQWAPSGAGHSRSRTSVPRGRSGCTACRRRSLCGSGRTSRKGRIAQRALRQGGGHECQGPRPEGSAPAARD